MSSSRKSYLLGVLSGVVVAGAAAFMVGMGDRPLAGDLFVTGDGHTACLWSASGGKLTFLDTAHATKAGEDEKGKKEKEEGDKGKDDTGKGKGKGRG